MKHLEKVNMKYTKHLTGAWKEIYFAIVMILKLATHSIFPQVFVSCYSDYVIGCIERRSTQYHKSTKQST